MGTGDTSARVPRHHAGGRICEALAGFEDHDPIDDDRAVKASRAGGLRPALTALPSMRPGSAPAAVLRANRVGADPGRDGQACPDGMPTAGEAAVLPVVAGGRAVFGPLRPLRPGPGRPRYLNAVRRLAPNPKVARLRPPQAAGAASSSPRG